MKYEPLFSFDNEPSKEKPKEILCHSCNGWVYCGNEDGKKKGFCLCKELYTYVSKTECMDYVRDKPIGD